MPHTFILNSRWALGDTVCLSALVRDIQLAYPGKYNLRLVGHYSNVFWLNNPYTAPKDETQRGQLIPLEYQEGIKAAGRGSKNHFLSWFHKSFKDHTGITVPVTKPKGDIHLTKEEFKVKPEGRYWLIVAGGKIDMTAKVWSVSYWQQTVNMLAAQGIRCVQAGGDFSGHFHPTLNNVEQYVGKTRSERGFFSLIAGAEGVICGITAAMHIAAVYDKPCVVIAGGREEPWWEHYSGSQTFGPQCTPVKMPHKFLHTVGLLDCGIGNLVKGCWRDRAVPMEQTDFTDPKKKIRLCLKPVTVGQQSLPQCMKMITPDHVVEAVMSYYADGAIPPIGVPAKKYSLPVVTEVQETTINVPPQLQDWNNAWNKQLPRQAEVRTGEPSGFARLEHPYIGGRFTLFVLSFADQLSLLDRCISSIVETCPKHRYDLRVALNQPSPRLQDYVKQLQSSGIVTKSYVTQETRYKYPAMREMFFDKSCPIETPYLCWFDDDSWCRKSDWMVELTKSIVLNHPLQGRLYGAWLYHDLANVKREGALREKWFKEATWWRGRNLYAGGGKRLSPNGSQIVFASGGFWALATHLIMEADIPDVRLNHNGGDITLGCQVTQAGYKVINFSPRPGKEIIAWSDAPRRGYSENFPWA